MLSSNNKEVVTNGLLNDKRSSFRFLVLSLTLPDVSYYFTYQTMMKLVFLFQILGSVFHKHSRYCYSFEHSC